MVRLAQDPEGDITDLIQKAEVVQVLLNALELKKLIYQIRGHCWKHLYLRFFLIRARRLCLRLLKLMKEVDPEWAKEGRRVFLDEWERIGHPPGPRGATTPGPVPGLPGMP